MSAGHPAPSGAPRPIPAPPPQAVRPSHTGGTSEAFCTLPPETFSELAATLPIEALREIVAMLGRYLRNAERESEYWGRKLPEDWLLQHALRLLAIATAVSGRICASNAPAAATQAAIDVLRLTFRELLAVSERLAGCIETCRTALDDDAVYRFEDRNAIEDMCTPAGVVTLVYERLLCWTRSVGGPYPSTVREATLAILRRPGMFSIQRDREGGRASPIEEIVSAMLEELMYPNIDLGALVRELLWPARWDAEAGRARPPSDAMDRASRDLRVLLETLSMFEIDRRHFALTEVEVFDILNHWLGDIRRCGNWHFPCLLALLPEPSEIPGSSVITVRELLPFAACIGSGIPLEQLLTAYNLDGIGLLQVTLEVDPRGSPSQIEEDRETRDWWRWYIRTYHCSPRFVAVLLRVWEFELWGRMDLVELLREGFGLGMTDAGFDALTRRFALPGSRRRRNPLNSETSIWEWMGDPPEWTGLSMAGRQPPGGVPAIPLR